MLRLDPGTFRLYADFLYQRTGIHMADSKIYLAESRLSKMVGPGKEFHSYQALWDRLKAAPSGELAEEFINVLTTNFSYFFRDQIHFDTLAWYCQERGPTSNALRFWSAASSTGEEAYSMAITLLRQRRHLPSDTKILASDISTRVLETAQKGSYSNEVLGRTFSDNELGHWFGPGAPGQSVVRPEVRSLVSFRHLNLKQDFPLKRSMDIIFLRNVLIYFDRESKEDVISKMERLLRPGGFLFVGLSESLVDIRHRLRMLKNSMYQKVHD